MKVLVTGASGFVGKSLCSVLEETGLEVVPVYRSHRSDRIQSNLNAIFNKSIDQTTDWTSDLSDIDVVVHLAARVHTAEGNCLDDLSRFRKINVEGTSNLAKQAAQSGVKRFVFLSSIKVNGERTDEEPFSVNQSPKPEDSYAISKMEAEDALREIEEATGMEVVIIRPPLVYGPDVKGNLMALANIIRKGVPLPLGAIDNRRDLVSIFNLCDLIRVCVLHPAASGGTFLVSDNESISTTELIRYMAKGLHRNARLLPIPVWALRFAAGLIGKTGEVKKLTGNLQLDISSTQKVLNWSPPLSVAESFQKMLTEG